jgi:hypothetical protein
MKKLLIITILLAATLSFSKNNAIKPTTVGDQSLYRYTFDSYVVFQKLHENKAVSDIAILSCTGKAKTCTYDTAKAVFMLKNQQEVSILNMCKQYLVLNYGAGPDNRSLWVFDITSGKQVLDTLYSEPVLLRGKDTLSFWIETGDNDFSKCERNKKWGKMGLTRAIEVEHYFNLKTLQLHPTANWRCTGKQ